MRITDKIMQDSFIANLNFSNERLFGSEIQVLTNKKINKPSDNPVGALNSLTIRTKISEIEQYQRNIGRSKTLLNITESIVTQLAEISQRLSSLTIQGASDTYGPEDKQSIASEVNQLLEQILVLANNRSESTFTFAGTLNDRAPYIADYNADGEIIDVKTAGSSGDINGLVGENIKLKINVNGEDLFEKGENLFEIAISIRDDLRAGATEALREDLNQINTASEKIYNTQAQIGARLNRINAAETRAENDIINFSEYLSNTEDVDAVQAIMNYQMELTTLQASLQAGALLIRPRLVNFLQ